MGWYHRWSHRDFVYMMVVIPVPSYQRTHCDYYSDDSDDDEMTMVRRMVIMITMKTTMSSSIHHQQIVPFASTKPPNEDSYQ